MRSTVEWRQRAGVYRACCRDCGGRLGTAQEVPGTAALNQGGDAEVVSVSCGSAGNCIAGGHYYDSSGASQAFVASETDGTWGTAEQVPGLARAG